MSLAIEDGRYDRELVLWVKSHYSTLQEYPLEGEWTKGILSDNAKSLTKAAASHGFIEKYDTIRRTIESQTVNVWRVTEEGREVIEEVDSKSDLELPCQCVGTGFVNTGDFIQCKRCNGRWTQGEING